jgi:hypothetical protein
VSGGLPPARIDAHTATVTARATGRARKSITGTGHTTGPGTTGTIVTDPANGND